MHFNYLILRITKIYVLKVCMYIVFYSQIFTHTAVSPTLSAVCNFFCLILEVSSPFKKFKKYTVSYILRVIINKNTGIYMLYAPRIQFPSYL